MTRVMDLELPVPAWLSRALGPGLALARAEWEPASACGVLVFELAGRGDGRVLITRDPERIAGAPFDGGRFGLLNAPDRSGLRARSGATLCRMVGARLTGHELDVVDWLDRTEHAAAILLSGDAVESSSHGAAYLEGVRACDAIDAGASPELDDRILAVLSQAADPALRAAAGHLLFAVGRSERALPLLPSVEHSGAAAVVRHFVALSLSALGREAEALAACRGLSRREPVAAAARERLLALHARSTESGCAPGDWQEHARSTLAIARRTLTAAFFAHATERRAAQS